MAIDEKPPSVSEAFTFFILFVIIAAFLKSCGVK